MKNLEFLEEAGLNSKESLVYKILLEHTKLPVKDLIKITKLKRGNLYDILYSLEDKKLIEEFDYKKIKHFRATSPKRLKELIDEKQKKLDEAGNKLDDLLPSLIKQYAMTSDKPGLYFYNDESGIEAVYRFILEDAKDVAIIASSKKPIDIDNDKKLKKQLKEQFERDINCKMIVSTDANVASLKRYNVSVKVIDSLGADSEIIIFSDKVAIISKAEDILVTLLTDKKIAQSLSSLFEVLFNFASVPKTIEDKKPGEFKIKINYNK